MAKQPIKIEDKDVYKEALKTVLKMIESGTHVENIMKYIKTILE